MAPIPQPREHLLPLSTTSPQLANARPSEKSSIEYPGHSQRSTSPPRSRMALARALFVALLVGCLVVVGFAHTDSTGLDNICSPEKGDSCVEDVAGHDRSALSRLIQSASPDALHKFLHTVTGFQHGVFDSDEAAVEAVLELDPTLSSTVAQLQRRQDNSTTTDVSPPPGGNTETTSSTPTTTSQPPSPPVDSSTTTTTLPPSSTAETTTTETLPNPPTTTTETSTTPTETPSSTRATTTEQTTTTAPTGTTTTSTGMTTSPRPTSSPKTNLLTTTLPGGAVTTQTSVVWVTPGVEETPTTANTAAGSLQSGLAAAGPRRPLLEVFIGGAAALAVLA